jgi:hypothetical protein
MDEARVRRVFETQLAANAHGIQRDARRITIDLLIALTVSLGVPLLAVIAAFALAFAGSFALDGMRLWAALAACGLVAAIALLVGFRMLMPPAISADERLKKRFVSELARPTVEQLRPGWTYDTDSSLSRDELFASNLFQRIPLTRFDVTARIRGRAHDLPFEMHEVVATGEGERQFMRILLIGFLAHVRLPVPVQGHVRFCRQQSDKTWRRPPVDGYRSIEAASSLDGHYHVDATPDGPDLASMPGMVSLMEDLAKRGWLVHVAFGGLSAWVAIERSRTWFEPRVLPAYSADDVLQLDYAFSVIELVADQLYAVTPVAG